MLTLLFGRVVCNVTRPITAGMQEKALKTFFAAKMTEGKSRENIFRNWKPDWCHLAKSIALSFSRGKNGAEQSKS